MADWVYVQVDEILHETDKAFLVRIGDEEIWLPYSQIEDYEDYEAGDQDVEIAITEWIAEKHDLL